MMKSPSDNASPTQEPREKLRRSARLAEDRERTLAALAQSPRGNDRVMAALMTIAIEIGGDR
jgi:hypothetical protein